MEGPIVSWKRRLAEAILPDRIARSLEPSLRREILGLESLRSDWMSDELREFDELKSSAWRGLASLGYEVVRHYKPKVVVELGTHMGMSALAIGLAMRDLGEGGKIYAVDTWQGDEQ